jgi:pyruvate formate-lyase activating enzyme-like uncharacterized protein
MLVGRKVWWNFGKKRIKLGLEGACEEQKWMLEGLRKKGFDTIIINFFIELSERDLEKLRNDSYKKTENRQESIPLSLEPDLKLQIELESKLL